MRKIRKNYHFYQIVGVGLVSRDPGEMTSQHPKLSGASNSSFVFNQSSHGNEHAVRVR